MTSTTIRVDGDVKARLDALRLPGERNYNNAVRRAVEYRQLEDNIRAVGLSTSRKMRLDFLRGLLEKATA